MRNRKVNLYNVICIIWQWHAKHKGLLPDRVNCSSKIKKQPKKDLISCQSCGHRFIQATFLDMFRIVLHSAYESGFYPENHYFFFNKKPSFELNQIFWNDFGWDHLVKHQDHEQTLPYAQFLQRKGFCSSKIWTKCNRIRSSGILF